MKTSGLFIVFFLGIVIAGYSQNTRIDLGNLEFESEAEKEIWKSEPSDPYAYFRALDAESLVSDGKWINLIQELDEKANKNPDQVSLLRTIFQKSHQRLFKKYELHTSFNTMLNEGKYDCVSGSAVLGLLLEKYGFDYEILETDYHVFIKVTINGKPIILESTLPVGGMITLPSEVEKYLSSYLPKPEPIIPNFNKRLSGSSLENTENSIFRNVSLLELAGLQYYNDAIVHFNNQSYGKSVNQLSKAYLLYSSDRIEGLRELSIELAFKSYGYRLDK
jgi:hypothetical protein